MGKVRSQKEEADYQRNDKLHGFVMEAISFYVQDPDTRLFSYKPVTLMQIMKSCNSHINCPFDLYDKEEVWNTLERLVESRVAIMNKDGTFLMRELEYK